MKISSTASCLSFSARELVSSASAMATDLALDCLSDHSAVDSYRSSARFVHALLVRDEKAIVEAFAEGLALPVFCGVPASVLEELEGAAVSVHISWPKSFEREAFVLVVPPCSVSW